MSRDFEEFIDALNAHEVRYLVAGAHTVAYHAIPRATKDLDVLVDPTEDNARRLLDALRAFFGGADLGYSVEDVTDPNWVLQLGVPPVRIDVLSELSGVASFAEAWESRVEGRFGAVACHYLGLDALIRAEEAADRPQDRADLVVLRKARARRESREE